MINRSRAYVGTEQIATLDYVRSGSAGGNHFVSDLMVRQIIGELIVGQTRANAVTRLTSLWTGCNFTGVFAVNTANTEIYDYSVNNLIEAISNQASNRFIGSGTGDQNGLGLDIPDAESVRTRVLGYATKLRAGLAAVNGHLGNTGRNVRDALQSYINNGF
jgi:hypothetical protein